MSSCSLMRSVVKQALEYPRRHETGRVVDVIGTRGPGQQCARNHDSVSIARPARMVDRCGIPDAAAGEVLMCKVPMCRMLRLLGFALAFSLAAQARQPSLP